MVGMNTAENKRVLIAAVDADIFGENLPEIFEVQVLKMPSTIYTGTYPQLKINIGTIQSRPDLIGEGIEGIAREVEWYYKVVEKQDLLGISL